MDVQLRKSGGSVAILTVRVRLDMMQRKRYVTILITGTMQFFLSTDYSPMRMHSRITAALYINIRMFKLESAAGSLIHETFLETGPDQGLMLLTYESLRLLHLTVALLMHYSLFVYSPGSTSNLCTSNLTKYCSL
jgi:hypothetical protein